MGDMVTFTLKLDRAGIPPTWASLWVQPDANNPDSEAQVFLATTDGKTWTQSFTYPGTSKGTLFLLRFQAPIGTVWTFEATRGGGKAAEDKGTTTVVIVQVAGSLS